MISNILGSVLSARKRVNDEEGFVLVFLCMWLICFPIQTYSNAISHNINNLPISISVIFLELIAWLAPILKISV